MKFKTPQTLGSIATLLGCESVGDEEFPVTGLNEIHVVESGDIVFVDHPKYYSKALRSAATTVLINKEVECPEGKTLLVSDDPFRDFNKLISHFNVYEHAHKTISDSAEIGVGTQIRAGAFIGNHVKIVKNCLIHANVTINDHCEIGDNCIIHSGAVIGSEAFYYQKRQNIYTRLTTCGRVILGNDVEIGASTTIDKGVTGDTTIGDGTKIDNMVHIGHDSVVGKNCLFAAQVGIAGCCVIEDSVVLWGQVGVISDVRIGSGAVVLGQSGVGNDLEGGKTYLGSPAEEARKKWRELAALRKLPEIIQSL